MRKWFRFVFPVLAVAVVMFLLWMVAHRAEPRYHERTLHDWTLQLSAGDQQEKAQAREALRLIGESAIPYLVWDLERKDSSFTWYARSYTWRFPFLYRLLPEWDVSARLNATRALGEIGPSASNAIPALLRLVQADPQHTHPETTAALMKIRGESIAPLVQTLEDTDATLNSAGRTNWLAMAATLEEFGTNAERAVPVLCRALTSTTNRIVAITVAMALVKIHSNPRIAVPALTDSLQRFGNDELLPIFAIDALAEFRDEARSATPAIRECLHDADRHSDYLLRYRAIRGLCRILPPTEIKPDEVKILVSILTQTPSPISKRGLEEAGAYLKQIDAEAAAKVGVR